MRERTRALQRCRRSACSKSFSVAHRPSCTQRPGVAQEGWWPPSLQSGSQTIAGSPIPDVPAAAQHCLRDPHTHSDAAEQGLQIPSGF